MAIKRVDAGWLVDSQPAGRGGKRFRKTLKTHAEAKQYDTWLKSQVNQDADWKPEKRDTRPLIELIDTWFLHHGNSLRSGEDTRTRLKAAAEAMGNPLADKFNVDTFARYRSARISAGVTPANMNREHAYFRAVFNELGRLGQWNRANPLSKLKQFRIQETELTYLTLEQIETLLASLAASRNPHVQLIAKVCLSTGARWGEAESLRKSQIRDGVIQFAKTKSGKVRAVPIDAKLSNALLKHQKEHGDGEHLFAYSASAFAEGIERTGIDLPMGQLTHVLRHTFASHFMMRGGNILTLQRILGHASLTMTMRYAHLAPEHLQEAKLYNPLAKVPVDTSSTSKGKRKSGISRKPA